jgi:hypothetical protein
LGRGGFSGITTAADQRLAGGTGWLDPPDQSRFDLLE